MITEEMGKDKDSANKILTTSLQWKSLYYVGNKKWYW
jgi:hypothetical protein